MRADHKIKFLTWAVVALGLLIVSMFSAFFYHVGNENLEENVQLEFYSMPMTGRDFRDVLNLSAEQMTEFREFNNRFRQAARDINVSLDKARDSMFFELKKEEPDMAKCRQLSAQIGELHRELKEYTCVFYMETREICTPAQVEKLEELFYPVFNSTPGFGYGRGQGQGQGPGRFRRGWQSQ